MNPPHLSHILIKRFITLHPPVQDQLLFSPPYRPSTLQPRPCFYHLLPEARSTQKTPITIKTFMPGMPSTASPAPPVVVPLAAAPEDVEGALPASDESTFVISMPPTPVELLH